MADSTGGASAESSVNGRGGPCGGTSWARGRYGNRFNAFVRRRWLASTSNNRPVSRDGRSYEVNATGRSTCRSGSTTDADDAFAVALSSSSKPS